MTEASEMYQENILDYYKNPRNYGRIENPDIKARDNNPLCGDEIEMEIKLSENKVKEAKFNGHGCAISQASASMLTEMLVGKTLEELKNIKKEDIVKLLGIEISPVRLKCALLSLGVLRLGLEIKNKG